MPDLYYIARYRVTYTPTDGDSIVLLDAGDWCDSPLKITADLAVQVEQPILSPWASHYSRGNAQTQLEFTQYAPAVTPEAAQLAGFTRWHDIVTHPEGELLLETAFYGPTPQVSQRLHATLNRCTWEDISGSIFSPQTGLALSYSFNISPITP